MTKKLELNLIPLHTPPTPVQTALHPQLAYDVHHTYTFSKPHPLSPGTLLAELREYNLEQQRRARADALSPDAPPEDSSMTRLKGKVPSR